MTALTSPESSVQSIVVFDDDAWEDLLNFVEEKRVIPIVGPELATVQTDAGAENLHAWLARSLAARLGQAATNGQHAPTLNDVIVRHLANHGRREDLYTRIRTIMREATFAPPPALQKLAAITDFDLYVSTTFDSLLEDALNAVRFGGLRTTALEAQGKNAEAEPFEREMLAWVIKRDGEGTARVAGQQAGLAQTLVALGKFEEAESLARASLAIREKLNAADSYPVASSRGVIGSALVGQKRFAEAEPLLIEACEALRRLHAATGLNDMQEAGAKDRVTSLVQLYEATGRPDKAEEWRKFLASIPAAPSRAPAPAR